MNITVESSHNYFFGSIIVERNRSIHQFLKKVFFNLSVKSLMGESTDDTIDNMNYGVCKLDTHKEDKIAIQISCLIFFICCPFT